MKIWTVEEIRDILNENDDQVGKALVALYDRQTEDEKVSKETKHSNGVGFNGADAEILSSFAEAYKEFGKLTTKQLVMARKKLVKYLKQLTRIVNESNEKAA